MSQALRISSHTPSSEVCDDDPALNRNTPTVERVDVARLPTDLGDFQILGYRSLISSEEFVALTKGKLIGARATLVRLHSQCLTGDVFGSLRCDCGPQLRCALELIAQKGTGAVVYQQQEGRGIGIINKIRAYALQDRGADTIEANERLGLPVDLRCYLQCGEILRDLGLRRIRVMSNNPKKLKSLELAGLEIVERVPLIVPVKGSAVSYLRTKQEKMGHLLS